MQPLIICLFCTLTVAGGGGAVLGEAVKVRWIEGAEDYLKLGGRDSEDTETESTQRLQQWSEDSRHASINSSDAGDRIFQFRDQYHSCWCPGDLSHQDNSRHGIGSIG